MKVKELSEALKGYNPEAEVCLHIWNPKKRESKFERLDQAAMNTNPKRFTLIEGHGCVE